MIRRGSIVTYHKAPNKPLKVISDVYHYNGLDVVTARQLGGRRSKQKQGIYAVSSLRQYKEE